ncbi:hypothetical protein CHS0354_022093 [Potamilus streckersoni]|uniref:Uncharacterized protein n=1 Tax=Potamilus streckersoni TaxID=2493646 RepID=A0AAE0SSH8_9BIVA|nr:hypothetical protein CHS0354_022093 [Potamilus streckersoni]
MGSYACNCTAGWMGSNCTEDINECSYLKCGNNATCTNIIGSYVCNCTSGWKGRNCTEDIDECLNSTCGNNATCINTMGSYACNCTAGWMGSNCTEDINECSYLKCGNNATCTNIIGSYVCNCTSGWKGRNCTEDVNECLKSMCGNNATCTNTMGSYVCNCTSGWIGSNCTEDIDECLKRPCENGGICKNIAGTFICNCSTGWRGSTCSEYQAFSLIYGSNAGDSVLTGTDDDCSPVISSSLQFPIYGVLYREIYVCSNGIVSFLKPVTTPTPARNDVELIQHSYLAPYFTDLDLRINVSSGGGTIYYHAYDIIKNQTLGTHGNVLQARDFVRNTESDQTSFTPTFLLLVTWDRVQGYPASSRKNESISFHVILVSDGLNTFVLYVYVRGQMLLQHSEVFIGYAFEISNTLKKDLNSFTTRALTIDSNVETNGLKGVLYYRLTPVEFQLSSDQLVCLSWWSEYRNNKDYYERMNDDMPSCPCSMNWLWWDNSFGSYYFQDNYTYCAVVRPSWSYSPHGKTCCYNVTTEQYQQTAPTAGGFLQYHKITNSKQYQAVDLRMKDYCCNRTKLCNLYYELRPVSRCYSTFPFFFAIFWGDPHIETLDKKKFTFNGWGEYTLVSLETTNATFYLQSRTSRAEKANGNLTDATIFSAFAAKDKLGSNVQVELNDRKDGLIIYAKSHENLSSFVDFTRDFADMTKEFDVQDEYISLSRDDATKTLTAVFSNGISFNVSVGVRMLSVSVVLPTEFKGRTRGLLGNFDGNPDNDFMFDNGTILSSNISERQIFNYGQTWEVNATKSVFIYPLGKNHSDFHYRNFVPKFLDEANIEKVVNAKKTCGEDNQECIFDLVFTENEAVANNTRRLEAQASTGQAEIANTIPTITGNNTVYVQVGQTVYVRANASDDGPFTYNLLYNTANATYNVQKDHSVVVSFVVKNEDPVSVSITAQDQLAVQSPALTLDIYLCTGCTNHGNCDFTQQRADNRSTSKFKYAVCICTPYWQGENCERDFNGCASTPCSPLRTCIDNPAPIHQSLNRAYNCSACPKGYVDGVVDPSKCIDINECNTSSHGCAQTCVNTDGNYYCACNNSFRLHLNGKDCQDINECQEGISHCDQDCNNTYGGYICTCKAGYNYNITKIQCVEDNRFEACDKINCSLADGCTKDGYGNASCFCRAGYSLTNENTCKDIDECMQNVCPQTCENSIGSFKCKCISGYTLGNDGTSCIPCSYPFYGTNCSNTCTCGRGADKCDPVKGCVCIRGWTGRNCDKDVNECTDNPDICVDTLKSCMNSIGSYTCTCISGYKAVNNTCLDINECHDPTLNDCEQICNNTLGGYTCSCGSGYNVDAQSKTKCKDIDECETRQSGCEQVCENSLGRFSCSCYFGYKLQTDRRACEIDENPCKTYANLHCSQICRVDRVNKTAVCGCIQGFKLGVDNQTCIDINECTDLNGTLNYCGMKRNCKNTNGTYICSCDTGFKLENDQRTCTACDNFHYGTNCAKECNCGVGSDKCDKVTGCVCKNGWIGDKCDTDQDECSNVGICSGGNIYCRNSPGSYQCVCKTGYAIDVSGLCRDINECTLNSVNDCEQLCTNTDGSYICSCQPGFLKNGTKCNDINECNGSNDCSQICTNTLGNYRCSCYEGFLLNTTDRRTCFPEDKCSSSNVTTCELKHALCISRNGSAQCYCPKGYEKDSQGYCIDVDECKKFPLPCSENCTNVNGSYICFCRPGKEITTDGMTCIECQVGKYGDGCAKNCSCNATNTEKCDLVNGSCTCKSGWEGQMCNANVNECNNRTICPEHSNCIDLLGSFLCECYNGFTKTAEGFCAPCQGNRYGNNCKEHCSCVVANTRICDNVNGTCNCAEGWRGLNCSNDVDECTSLNTTQCTGKHEICLNTFGSYICSCSTGFAVDADRGCIDIDECLEGTDTCVQGCNNTLGNYKCVCNPGYSGDGISCVEINECNTSPCKNGGNCTNTDGSYFCNCSIGWQGINCNVDVNECTNNPCVNGGNCTNQNGSYRCNCTSGWSGSNCSYDIDECFERTASCQQACENNNGSYNCSCYLGFRGNGYDCIPDAAKYSETIVLKFNFTLPLHESLNESNTYKKYSKAVNDTIWEYFHGKLGNDFESVEIIRITYGSLNVEFRITTQNKDTVKGFLIKNVADVYKATFVIDNFNVSVASALIGNLTVNETTDQCLLYTALTQPCPNDYTCIIEGKGPTCRKNYHHDDKFELVVGLGVGIPLGILFVLIIVVVVIYCARIRKKEDLSLSSSNEERSRVTLEGFVPFGIPTKMSSLSHNNPFTGQSKSYLDMASVMPQHAVSATTDQQFPQSHPGYDTEYEGHAYKDDDDKQRELNFSWDFILNSLNPNQKYEIQRPRTEISPNPLYGAHV